MSDDRLSLLVQAGKLASMNSVLLAVMFSACLIPACLTPCLAYKVVLDDVTNQNVRTKGFDGESDCKIITSPPAFGAFDLGINRVLNQQSPLYQSLRADVKVSAGINSFSFCFLHNLHKFFI